MPEMKGIELLQKVRAHEVFKTMPFILVTSVADTDTVLRAKQSKVSAYVTKPMSPQILAEKVKVLFGKGGPIG